MNIVVVIGLVVTLITVIPVLVQLRGHPRGLFILFFAEMWERFSYYGMRSLLIFYLTQQFLFDDVFAQGQYGAYTSLVYLTPLIGGMVADRYLGTRKAIAFGALLLVAGHLAMGIEGRPATQTLTYAGAAYEFQTTGVLQNREVCLKVAEGCYAVTAAPGGGLSLVDAPADLPLPAVMPRESYSLAVTPVDPLYVNILYLALALIVMGVGFLKPNISTIVGQLYAEQDPRRDSGFTLYYYGINLGAFWAAVSCGLVGQAVGWWAGFGLAGLGMLAGYIVFVWGKPLLEGKGEPPEPEKLKAPVLGPITREGVIYLLGLASVGVAFVLVQRYEAVGWLLAAGSVAVLGYLGWFMVAKCDRRERDQMLLALILIGFSVVFWTLFEQAGSSMNQFAERNTALPNDGFLTVAPAQTQSFNSAFILLFAPVFAFVWAWLGRRGRDPNASVKFGLALVQVGLGFLVLVYGVRFAGPEFQVPLVFLALAYLLHTTGELCLSPVGLSLATKLSPAAVVGTVMAVWFLASSWAQWLGGLIAQMTAAETVAGQVLDPGKALETYAQVFQTIGLWGLGAGVVLLALSPLLKRLGHGVN